MKRIMITASNVRRSGIVESGALIPIRGRSVFISNPIIIRINTLSATLTVIPSAKGNFLCVRNGKIKSPGASSIYKNTKNCARKNKG
jgi:hypothetical protein